MSEIPKSRINIEIPDFIVDAWDSEVDSLMGTSSQSLIDYVFYCMKHESVEDCFQLLDNLLVFVGSKNNSIQNIKLLCSVFDTTTKIIESETYTYRDIEGLIKNLSFYLLND